jgi:hypothetical protein
MGILLLLAVLQASQIEPLRLPPTDECRQDRSFVEFRARLSASIERKDVAALRQLVARDIDFNLGAGGGWPAFVREWRLDRPAESELWRELSKVLSLGCEEYDGQRIAPGNFNQLAGLGEGLPPFFAVQKGATLRSRPDDTASVVLLLENHVLVEVLDDEPEIVPEGWLHARLTNGRSGYVRLTAVRSALDYRASFEKRRGRWVMVSFITGD